ncbi:MAG: hypothetical protein ACRYG8_07980 [Janthinobacterium lividum]
MAGQYDRRSSGEDVLLFLGLFVFLFAIAAFFIWAGFHAQISLGGIAFADWQMQVAGWFTDRYAALDAQALAANPATVKPLQLWGLLHNVGLFYRVPAICLMVVLAVCCFFGNAPAKFTGELDLKGLMAMQAISFPTGAAFVERDLKLVAPAEGKPRPSDPALHLPEWIDRFARSPTGLYREDLARIRLADQLGEPWTGVETASPHVRAMFVAFALHAARHREEAVTCLGELSASLPSGANEGPAGPLASLAFDPAIILAMDNRLVADASLVAPCAKVASGHAYTTTAMMAVLTFAREKAGVLAPGEFAFLKLVDRQLWYALHSLGFPGGNRNEQPNPRAEALGARDHWAAECDIGAPIKTPSLDRAISAIGSRAGTLFPLEKLSTLDEEFAK